jgi:hypothetical protein
MSVDIAPMYCCGVTADRHRPNEMKVEDIPISLTDDEQFREFDKLIQPPFRSDRHGAIVHATLVGRFFSGRQIKYPKGTSWGGYGHMGCCSLLAIQEVKSLDGQDRDDLDYGASADQPDIDKTGCGYRFLTPIQPTSDLIKAQQQADQGTDDWFFDDPRRVASSALARCSRTEESSITGLKETRKAQGRFVYEWTPAGKAETYMIVVSDLICCRSMPIIPSVSRGWSVRRTYLHAARTTRSPASNSVDIVGKSKLLTREACHEIPRRTRQPILLSRGAVSAVGDSLPKNK